MVLQQALHIGLVAGLDVGLREGGLLEIAEESGRRGVGPGPSPSPDVGSGQRRLEALQIGAGLAAGRSGR